MKTLSHWQWLILSKGGARFGSKKPRVLAIYRARTVCLKDLPTLNPRGWRCGVNPSLVLPNRAPSLTAQPALYANPVPPSLARRAGGVRVSRALDHSFLVSGLVRFGEELSGSAFSLIILRNLLETASPAWLLEVFLLHSRLSQLFKLSRSKRPLSITSPGHPWYGGAKIIVSAICSRDPFLLTQWAKRRMARMKVFAHKRFLRLLGSFLRGYVRLRSSPTRVLGFNLVTTGKISVTGNAMSRTMLTRFGKAGINNLSYRASSSFTLIRTKTGCLGLNLVLYY